jgi:hypothetical protein
VSGNHPGLVSGRVGDQGANEQRRPLNAEQATGRADGHPVGGEPVVAPFAATFDAAIPDGVGSTTLATVTYSASTGVGAMP